MKTILDHHRTGPQFLDLLLSFATGNKESEAGTGSMITKNNPDGSYEVQYRLSYVEEVIGNSSSSWAIRQTGIYHRHVPNGPGSIWIFLHPRPNSTLQQRIEACALEWDHSGGSFDDWELSHILALSSYFGDWRWYLKTLSADTEHIASVALSLDFAREGHYGRGTDTLQGLHSLLEKVLPLSPRLRSTLATVKSLKSLYETLQRQGLYGELHSIKILDELRSYEVHTHEHIATVALLEKRIQEILSLLAVALNLKSQSTAVKINRNIWSLTKDTVDDSATVRLITIVTLIFLPASFVTSFLGMNLFTFQTSDGSGFAISRQFWIFVLMTVSLTFITVGSWMIMSRKRRKQKNRNEQMSTASEEVV
ncbi:uncharacterized protein K444DRAFT_644408 [Hyaloscypha bicolor E]|uniref:CorA-like transporter domain-containing protein n=1 Tax=Hyaloscypha bicolor E TaxID=1095630 RepID=A0A2J6T3B6_9HELO|nr:uncharacterized protein K444DRAFT_644408 [Hyaloscypha bicolor E]PMD57524.1 hypothetical protein K444DRAFT_644408 [Hyaloscypha bicolor E]